jgi:N-methylhydantoinase A
MTAGLRVGVDIGGTFTDTVIIEEGKVRTVKVPSTPSDFVDGLMTGVRRGCPDLSEMALFSHGTTVATNAAITRSGAATALLTTTGFRDTLGFRRTDREDQFNLWWQPPPTLIKRRYILEVPERMDFDGNVVEELDEDAAREIVARLGRLGIEAVAIVFLHSFVNPAHELRMAELVAEGLPGAYVCASHEILPEILEYERSTTTLLNAYVGPVMSDYFGRLDDDLRSGGYDGDVLISSSSGGVMTPSMASEVPAKTMTSGPAAGVIAARELAARAGYDSAISFDMGGTSLDIGVVDRGEIRRTNEWDVAFRTPVRFPAIDVSAIGAGGGSIAWIDEGGLLRSGPASAGADPGPASYDRGGEQPTNTDAQLVLGRLSADRFLGGEMVVHQELAEQAIRTHVAEPLGIDSVEHAADMIVTISNNNMVQALRLASVARGLDPRDFVLVAFGGAGPLFAAEIARESSIPTVLVPPKPGLVSALGLLMMDLRHEIGKSLLRPVTKLTDATLDEAFAELERDVREHLAREGVDAASIVLEREADMRYFGTTHTITQRVAPEGANLEALVGAFESIHERDYGYLVPQDVAEVELATIRVAGIGQLPKVDPPRGVDDEPRERGSRSVHFGGESLETPVLSRAALSPGDAFDGPAVVEQTDSTTIVPPGMSVVVDEQANLIITTNAA